MRNEELTATKLTVYLHEKTIQKFILEIEHSNSATTLIVYALLEKLPWEDQWNLLNKSKN